MFYLGAIHDIYIKVISCHPKLASSGAKRELSTVLYIKLK